MATLLPVVTTAYTIVTGGTPLTSTPQQVSLEAGCVQIVLSTRNNTFPVFLRSSPEGEGDASPGPQTDFTPTGYDAGMMLPKDSFFVIDIPRRSERPGTNTFWVWGEQNGDILRVTQIVRNLQ